MRAKQIVFSKAKKLPQKSNNKYLTKRQVVEFEKKERDLEIKRYEESYLDYFREDLEKTQGIIKKLNNYKKKRILNHTEFSMINKQKKSMIRNAVQNLILPNLLNIDELIMNLLMTKCELEERKKVLTFNFFCGQPKVLKKQDQINNEKEIPLQNKLKGKKIVNSFEKLEKHNQLTFERLTNRSNTHYDENDQFLLEKVLVESTKVNPKLEIGLNRQGKQVIDQDQNLSEDYKESISLIEKNKQIQKQVNLSTKICKDVNQYTVNDEINLPTNESTIEFKLQMNKIQEINSHQQNQKGTLDLNQILEEIISPKANGTNKHQIKITHRQQNVIISLSQTQRQNLLNLIQNQNIKKNQEFLKKLLLNHNQKSQNSQRINYNRQLNKQFQQHQQLQIQRKINCQKSEYKIGTFKRQQDWYKMNNYQNNDYFVTNLKEDSKNSSQKQNIDLLRGLSLQSQNLLAPLFNKYTNRMQIRFTENRILGGGGGYSLPQNKIAPITHEQLKKPNKSQIVIKKLRNDKNFIFEEQKDEQSENGNKLRQDKQNEQKQEELNRNKKRITLDECYQIYFTNEIVEKDEIETHIDDIIKDTLYHYRRQITNEKVRVQVIDLINLMINYLIIINQNQITNTIEEDIRKLERKLVKIRKYCFEQRKKYGTLDLYSYLKILISLNSSRKGLDEKNKSTLHKISEKIIQVAKFGAGFVSLSNAIKNITEINYRDLERFFQEIKQIYNQIAQSGVIKYALDAKENYDQGSLSDQIRTLWMRKIKKIGQKLLDPYEDIIFYLEERDQLKSNETILFIYMQINYLLMKLQENDKELKGLFTKLKENNQENLIIDFANQLQLKQFNNGFIEALKVFANYIVVSEQFRYIKAQLLLKFAQIIKHFGEEKQKEYLSIMLGLCSNYLSEKQMSVKIVYKGSMLMKEMVHSEKYYEQIADDSQYMEKQLKQYADEENQDKIEQIKYKIEKKEDIPKLLAINFVEMWENSVKQRLDKNKLLHKDDILIEALDLYIHQSITYQDGNQTIKNKYHQNVLKISKNDALYQIIQNFLIPNSAYPSKKCEDVLQEQNLQQELSQPNSCKILSILAEGGSGKSMLLKKLEVELLNGVSEKIKNEKAEFIPFIIKCNGLDKEKPSIEDYLASQNLDKDKIEILKVSERNKIIMLDGFDEYTGSYFKVFKELKIYDWVNTIVIVTSRLEKISISDAKIYFSYYDQEGKQGDDNQFAIVTLNKISELDIKLYLRKYQKKILQNELNINQQDYENAISMIFQNHNLIQLLKLPINLYLTTRMMIDINLKEKDSLEIFKSATDQIEIQELFFNQQFQKQSKLFTQKLSFVDQQDLIEIVTQAYFEYFQTIAMEMFVQKGQKSNFLFTRKASIKFCLREEIKAKLKQYRIEEKLLIENLNSYVDSRIITRVKQQFEDESENESGKNNVQTQDKSNQVTDNIHDSQSEEFEFRHKSIFEYFAARAMKFDFDLHKENICNLKLEELKNFSINKKQIMNRGQNNSEQQILLKLFKLIHLYACKVNNQNYCDYKQNYSLEELKQNNRYIQYIRKSYIEKYDQKSTLDTGASNILSALFISKFPFNGLVLHNCSLSKLYNQNKKNIIFDQCNLNNAFLENNKIEQVQSSYTNQSTFDQLQRVFSIEDMNSFNSVIFENDNLISVNSQGFINRYKINDNDENKFTLDQMKKVTSDELLDIKRYSTNYVLIRASFTLFLVRISDFEIIKMKRFESQICYFDCKNSVIIIQLKKNQINYLGNFERGFSKIELKGINAMLSKEANFLVTNDNDQLFIYNKQSNYIENQQFKLNSDLIQMTFSEDGKYMVTLDNLCNFWDLENGFKNIKQIQIKLMKKSLIQVSQNCDYIAIIDKDNHCLIFDNNFEQIAEIECYQNVASMSFSEDGYYLAIIYDNDTCKIYQRGIVKNIKKTKMINYGEKVYKFQYNLLNAIRFKDNDSISKMTFSQNGKYLVTGCERKIIIWSLEKGFEQIRSLNYKKKLILSINFTFDDQYLAATFDDGDCYIWDTQDEYKLNIITSSQTSEKIISQAFSYDRKYMVIGLSEGMCEILDMKNFEQIQIFSDHGNSVSSCSFSHDGIYLATGSEDGFCTLYKKNESTQKYLFYSTIIQYNNVELTFTQNNKYLAICSFDKQFLLWDLEKKKQKANPRIDTDSSDLISASFSLNSLYLATIDDNDSCKIWDVEKEFELIYIIKIKKIMLVTLSFDGKYLATSSKYDKCDIWDLENRFEQIQSIEDSRTNIIQIAFSVDEKYLATVTLDSNCMIWNLKRDLELAYTLQVHTDRINSLSFSYDGKYLSTISNDNTCRIWKVELGFKLFQTIENVGERNLVSFSQDNKYLATCFGEICKIWNMELNFQQYHHFQVEKTCFVTFTKNGKYLVTGLEGDTYQIWDTQYKFQLIDTIKIQKQLNIDKYQITLSQKKQYLGFLNVGMRSGCEIKNAKKGFTLINEILKEVKEIPLCAYLDDHSILQIFGNQFFQQLNELESLYLF